MIKKLLTRIGVAGGTLALIVAGAAAFSAFEAHVVNVTATINNALTVPQEDTGITFGNVFPEQVSHMPLQVSLSDSFSREPSVDDVSYFIRQKPKCVSDTDPSVHPQVTEDGTTFVCPAGSHEMPLLCPYLSKHLVVNGCDPTLPVGTENACTGIDAFHGTASSTLWTETVTENTEVSGHLVKGGDTQDNWDIDLHAPCFKGECAQDNVVPADFEADPSQEGQTFGCDLWVEVNGISTTTTESATGTLTVVKQVVNSDASPSSFPLFVDGASVTNGVATTTSSGTHQVSEAPEPTGFAETFGGDCGDTGLVTVPAGGSATCDVINTFTPPPPLVGSLTVTKVVVGTSTPASSFSLFVDGSSVTSGVATTTSVGSHVVSEGAHDGFTSVISGNCDTGGNVTVSTSTPASCTVTNTWNTAQITVDKVVADPGGLGGQVAGDFTMTIDGNPVTQGSSTVVSVGTHTIGETDSKGDTVTYSGACDGSNQVTVANGDNVTCTVTNTIPFFTLTVTKTVTNDDGGTAQVSDFNFFVGSTPVTSGVSKNFAPGTYTVTESGVTGYAATFGGDCDKNSQQVIGTNGSVKSCTINNNDIAPNVTLVNHPVGGPNSATDFVMTVDGVPVPTGGSKQVSANSGHIINETLLSGYSFTSEVGTGSQGDVCPSTLGGSVTLKPGEVITCTITETHS